MSIYSINSTTTQSKTLKFSVGDAMAYRFGFNGMEGDNEVTGSGNMINYKARIYDPRLGRFLSVDPLTKSFPELTPFQFASNTPLWAVDLDGLEARVYTDIRSGGHAFLSVVDDKGVLHVYTYGQYGTGKDDGKSRPFGDGSLVHLSGAAAKKYIKSEFKKMGPNLSVYEVSKEKVDKNKIMKYFESEMKGKPESTSSNEVVQLAKESEGSKAVEYSKYMAIPITSCGTDNCVTVASDGLEAGGFKVLNNVKLPMDVNNTMSNLSKLQEAGAVNTGVKTVTEDAKKEANTTKN